MIQRKQTLFLIFSVLVLAGYFFAPLIRIQGALTGIQFVTARSPYLTTNVDFPYFGHYFVFWCCWAAGITIGLNLATIFLYRSRMLQIVLCWLSILPALFAFCFAYYRMTTTEMIQDQLFYYGNISPIAAVVFIFMAMYYIRKDDELVKSVDRLR